MIEITPMVGMSALLAGCACLFLCAGLFVTGRRKRGFVGIAFEMWMFASVALAVIGILLIGIGS